jgi:hypothetical protein
VEPHPVSEQLFDLPLDAFDFGFISSRPQQIA